MKQLTMILAATMIFLALGCEKRVGQAEDADRFDEKIDGPVCVLTVSADENLLADQKKISRQARADAESVEIEEKTDDEDTTPSPTPAPAGDSISAVKQVLGDAIAATKAKQYEQMMKVYTDADAAAIRPLMTAFNELREKLPAFEKVTQRKLGTKIADVLSLMMVNDGGNPVVSDFLELDIKAVTFERRGDNVFVTDSKDIMFTFINTSHGWRLQLYPFERQLFGVKCEVYVALNKAIDEITAGINSGDITRKNGKTKVDEIFEKYVKPPRKKVDELLKGTVRDAPDSTKPKTPTAKPSVKPRPRPDERLWPVERLRPDERRPRPEERRHRPDERHNLTGERRRRS